ncbi:MAG TPA: gas vesicle protein GvpD P-loop domain-containing protein [Thermoplasmata archaeon]|nr:gas vesicle protein GvpD P-loop domain-containing protein [Thermoplasmata archaeon]
MSSAVRLPRELLEFLNLPGPQSLIIRGPPGSGKSTLCLALLEASPGHRILLTSRVSREEFRREFPWMGENGMGSLEIIDTSETEVSVDGVARAAAEAALVTDARPSERRALSEFLQLPSAVQEAWSRIPTGGPSTIVIDSWDALVEQYLGIHGRTTHDGIDRAEIERMLLRRMARSRAHLVLALEREDQTQLDYLANGVIVTRREMTDDRLERWLLLPKLRGVRVANASYPFTVEGARFQCIDPVRAYAELRRGAFEPEPDALPGLIWPGSRTFAESFGRLPVGKITLIETDDDLPDFVLQFILGPIVGQTMHAGGHVIMIPSGALTPSELWAGIEGAVPRARVPDLLRILDASGQLQRTVSRVNKDLAPSVVSPKSLAPTGPEDDPTDSELSRWLRGGSAPGLGVIYGSGLESLAGAMKMPLTEEMAAGLPGSIQTSLGAGNVHLVAVVKPDSLLFRPLRSLAAIHLRLHWRQGRVFVYGLKPWTPGYVLTESANGGPYDLLRVV